MKTFFTTFCFLLFINCTAQENYEMKINGKTFDLELNKDYQISLNGREIIVFLKLKDTLLFDGGGYKFSYPSYLKVLTRELSAGITQSSILNAEGSGVIIQKYFSLDPSPLKEILLNEITKESKNYGYEVTRKVFKRKLKSNQELEVIQEKLTYLGESQIYEIASVSKKDSGLVIITMIQNAESDTEGLGLIRSIWETMEVK